MQEETAYGVRRNQLLQRAVSHKSTESVSISVPKLVIERNRHDETIVLTCAALDSKEATLSQPSTVRKPPPVLYASAYSFMLYEVELV